MYGQLHRILLLAPVFLIAVSATSRALLEADIAADAVLGASGDVMGSEYGDSAGSYGDGDIMFMDGGYGQVTMADMSDDVVPPSPGEYGEAGAAGAFPCSIVTWVVQSCCWISLFWSAPLHQLVVLAQ